MLIVSGYDLNVDDSHWMMLVSVAKKVLNCQLVGTRRQSVPMHLGGMRFVVPHIHFEEYLHETATAAPVRPWQLHTTDGNGCAKRASGMSKDSSKEGKKNRLPVQSCSHAMRNQYFSNVAVQYRSSQSGVLGYLDWI